MRTLLIVFAILLLLLTLLGAFGGSIKYNGPFFDVINNSTNKVKFTPRLPGNELFSNFNGSENFGVGGTKIAPRHGGNLHAPFIDGPQMPTQSEMPNISVPQMPTQVSNFLDALPTNSSMKLPSGAPTSSSSPPIPSMSSTNASASVSGSHFYDGPPPVMSKPSFLEKPQQSNFTDAFNIEPFEADKHSSLPAVY